MKMCNYRHCAITGFLGRFASILTFALAFSVSCPQPAFALSLLKVSGGGSVLFTKDSASLSDSNVELGHHLPLLTAVRLEVLLVVAYYTGSDSEDNKNAQLELALKRANAVRQFFVDSGVPNDKIYSEASLLKAVSDFSQLSASAEPESGTVVFEYIGPCKPDYRAICERECPGYHCM